MKLLTNESYQQAKTLLSTKIRTALGLLPGPGMVSIRKIGRKSSWSGKVS